MMMTSCEDIERYFECAKQLVLQAGQTIKDALGNAKNVQVKAKYRALVTEHDKAVEDALVSGLRSQFPDHKFLAEESLDEDENPQLTDEPTWIIDPIDGTTNFVHGFPQCCISVGLTVNKEVQLALVYSVWNNEFYTAKKGRGAYLNDNQIRASSVTELGDALIITEPGMIKWATRNRDIIRARIETLIDATEGVRNVGSAALALAYVARGNIDAFHMDGLKAWDVAAGCLLIQEAGGSIIDTKGGPFNIMEGTTIAAGTETLAKEISKLIVESDLQTQRKRLKRT